MHLVSAVMYCTPWHPVAVLEPRNSGGQPVVDDENCVLVSDSREVAVLVMLIKRLTQCVKYLIDKLGGVTRRGHRIGS